MKIHILTNALEYGDAVSTHCILLKKRASELGLNSILYAEFSDDRVRDHVAPVDELIANSSSGDILLHQLFNHTRLLPYVEAFPGKRVLMYHNITPPEFFPSGSQIRQSCRDGLELVKSLTGLYVRALGMSDYSRRHLDDMGYPSSGVFPLFVDLDRLLSIGPDASIINRRWTAGTTFLFVGRIAPNKSITDLVRFLAAYRKTGERARLILVGDDRQHPAYVNEILRLSAKLGIRSGHDLILAGKIPDAQLVAWYRTADAFIFLSEHEGFGAPLLESMAFGLPTFAYAATATEETLGGSGVLLRSKDFSEMAAKVRSVLSEPAQKSTVIEDQKKRVSAFTAPAQREALQTLLDEVGKLNAPVQFTPRISVVINTYNRARQLERCLETLRRQVCRDFEVVVVNGPSTDDTRAVLRRFEGQVRVVETSSRVLSVSRNLGILAASGELVAFIDDDAVSDPNWLKWLARPFIDPTVGAAGGLVYRWTGRDIEFQNGIIDVEGFVRWNEPVPGAHWSWADGYINTVSGNNCIFRRTALEKIGGFDECIEYYHDEADVVMRLQKSGFRTVHVGEAVVYHEAARSENRAGKHTLNWRVICKNTLYCALKNYYGSMSKRRLARRISTRLVRKHMLDVLQWWTRGHLNTRQFFQSEYACASGILTGIRRGLNPRPIYREIPPAADPQFLPYSGNGKRHFSVCLLSQSLPKDSPGGIATYTLNLSKGLAKRGVTVHVISRGESWESEFRDDIWFHTAAPVEIDQYTIDQQSHGTAAKNLAYSAGVRRKLLDIEARWGLDIVESPNWDAEGLLPAMEHRIPMVVRSHSPLFKVAETQGWSMDSDLQMCSDLEGLLIRHADVVTGSTRALLNTVGERFDIAGKQALVPLGIDVDAPSSSRTVSTDKTILFVGRLEPRKGIHTLLEAIPRVFHASGDINFEIAGRDGQSPDGPTWKTLCERQAGEWKRRVHFHGEVSQAELAGLYARCDVFVAPSLYESFGLIYLEAMALGKPVIACHTGGVPEVVIHDETGILVPPGDSSALADAILRIVSDDALAQRLGESGRRRYLASFTSSAMAERTADLFQKVSENWNSSAGTIWNGSPFDLRRDAGAVVTCYPLTGQLCLLIEKGEARTPVYGPYVELQPGEYRAEFLLCVEVTSEDSKEFGIVDVFSMKEGTLGERVFGAFDFAACPGSILDVYFRVGAPVDDCEFRLHTNGTQSIYLRQIIVRRWPPHSSPA